MTSYYKNILSIFFVLTLLVNCKGGKVTENLISFDSIKNIPIEKWEKLSLKKIYFGHKSVGFNIMEGVQDVLKEHPEIKLKIVETSIASDLKIGIFAHSAVGKNADTQSKINAFASIMDSGTGKKADFAALKFCWADMMVGADIDKIFVNYDKSISELKQKYPDMTVIHFTAPLTTNQTGPKAWIKKLTGKPIWGAEENIKRNEYNELLFKKYKGKEIIFDIATIESTYPDGTRSTFIKDGKTYYIMVPEYTYDHGHLNELGRKKVAEQFLILLSKLV